ncbi:hypothetical protein M404DRAFT_166743, partial [Pisolithus tinctorius Marx 270]
TRMYQDPMNFIPPHHWIWADSAYPMEKWCVMPFKKPRGGSLTHRQNIYNLYLSKVQVRVEHAFAALKGCFQSLQELWLKVNKDSNLHVTMYWIICCMILHNMVIHFESEWRDMLGEGMMCWVIREGEELDGGGDEDVGEEQWGTPGQQHRLMPMERLFKQHGICM